jgi:transposase-like protein
MVTPAYEISILTGENKMSKEERITHWRTIIEKQAVSGQSIAAFCRDHKIPAHQFHWWRGRFRKENSQSKGSGFLKLVPFSKSQHSGIRIRLNNGVFIEVEQGFDPHTLRGVIEAICGRETT